MHRLRHWPVRPVWMPARFASVTSSNEVTSTTNRSRDVVDVAAELFEVREGRDVDAFGRARFECALHFELSLRRGRPIGLDSFTEDEPRPRSVVDTRVSPLGW